MLAGLRAVGDHALVVTAANTLSQRPLPGPFLLALAPAAITLVVTLARLGGELVSGPAWLFSTASGGGAALVGITWLVPLSGVWFGFRLARAGRSPSHRLRTVLLHLVAAAIYVGGFQLAGRIDGSTHDGIVTQILCMSGVALAAALLAVATWPDLGAVNLLYGLLARAPTATITVLAVHGAWGTHFEKFGPHDYAGMAPGEAAAWLAFTQIVFWVPFTAVVGGLFGALAALCGGRTVVSP